VSRSRTFLKYWLPVVLWMGLIFTASGDAQSSLRSSRIIEPILRWLFPQLDNDTVQHLVFLIRKCAHLTEFAVLALLFWRALRKPERKDLRPWLWTEAGLALLCAMLYATSDEVHQLFVASREGKVSDVLLDTSGAALGLLAIWAVGRWRKLW
jgi:VanZ family protein